MASTTAIARLVREAMKRVNYLDAIARNTYAGSAEQLRAWASASHIEHDPVHAPPPPPA